VSILNHPHSPIPPKLNSIIISRRRQAQQLERERQRQEKEQHVQHLYMQKMAAEADRRREAEARMSNLEREEKELITRLRKTQEMQEKVLQCIHHGEYRRRERAY